MGLAGLCRLCAGIHLTDFYLRPFQVLCKLKKLI